MTNGWFSAALRLGQMPGDQIQPGGVWRCARETFVPGLRISQGSRRPVTWWRCPRCSQGARMHTPHAPAAEGDDWISIEDAADLCRVSANTVRVDANERLCVRRECAGRAAHLTRPLYARLHRVALCVNIS